MRGRRPKPSHLKLIAGNPGKREIPEAEPVPEGDLVDPPDWMTDQQRDTWRYAIQHAPAGLLKKIDRGMLAVWCVAEAQHAEASQMLAKVGSVLKNTDGDPVPNPYLAIQDKAAARMARAETSLGFSPTSRSRVKVDSPKQKRNRFASIAEERGD